VGEHADEARDGQLQRPAAANLGRPGDARGVAGMDKAGAQHGRAEQQLSRSHATNSIRRSAAPDVGAGRVRQWRVPRARCFPRHSNQFDSLF
jgi:hypothetical protein